MRVNWKNLQNKDLCTPVTQRHFRENGEHKEIVQQNTCSSVNGLSAYIGLDRSFKHEPPVV